MTPRNDKDGWHKCGTLLVYMQDRRVRKIATLDRRPAEFYHYTRRCRGDGWERCPIPKEGITWICAYRRLQLKAWTVRS